MITNAVRLAKFHKSSPEIQSQYGSLETGRLLGTIISKYSIEKDGEFIDLVGDTLLGFFSYEALPQNLSDFLDVTKEIASQITTDLSPIFDKLKNTGTSEKQIPTDQGPDTESESPLKRPLDNRGYGTPPPPSPITGGAPLTREAVLQSFSHSQESAPDSPQGDSKPAVGYEAYPAQKQNNPEPAP